MRMERKGQTYRIKSGRLLYLAVAAINDLFVGEIHGRRVTGSFHRRSSRYLPFNWGSHDYVRQWSEFF